MPKKPYDQLERVQICDGCKDNGVDGIIFPVPDIPQWEPTADLCQLCGEYFGSPFPRDYCCDVSHHERSTPHGKEPAIDYYIVNGITGPWDDIEPTQTYG